MGAMEKLTRLPNRFSTCCLILVPLTVTFFLILIATYGPHPAVNSFWPQIHRPQQSFDDSKAQLEEPEGAGVISDIDQQKDRTSIESQTYKPSEKLDFRIKVSPPAPPADLEEYLAICLLVKNDPEELREFFTHHYYHHGIRRFYVYDDGSVPKLSSHPVPSTYNVPSSVLDFTYIEPDSVNATSRKRLQQHTMERCIEEHGKKHRWLGLLDPDEFVEMRHPLHPTLLGWLRHWDEKGEVFVEEGEVKSKYVANEKGKLWKVGGLGISWLPHNSADLVENPASGGFRRNFNTCVAGVPVTNTNRPDFWMITHTKSFVIPEAVKYIQNIHLPKFKEGWTRFSEQGDFDFPASIVPPKTEYWALHHYPTGSRKYFEAKQSKGRSQGPGMWPIDEWYWDRYHENVTTYTCNEMTKYDP